MFKTIKKIIITLFIVIAVFLLVFLFWGEKRELSGAQKELLDLMGRPSQFSLTYLPSDGGGTLLRQETWFYPENGEKVIFLNGSLISSEEIKTSDKYSKTELRIEDFDFYSSVYQIKKLLGPENVTSLDLPVFTELSEGIETYVSADALFVFEQGYLTYMETVD